MKTTPCVEDWRKYDEIAHLGLMNEVGCRPVHWKETSTLSNCTSSQQYAFFDKKFNEKQLMPDDILKPCQQIERIDHGYKMTGAFHARNEEELLSAPFTLSFNFLPTTYFRIEHIQAFGTQSLVGNIGG